MKKNLRSVNDEGTYVLHPLIQPVSLRHLMHVAVIGNLTFLIRRTGIKYLFYTKGSVEMDIAVSNYEIINQQLLDQAYTPYSNERPSIHTMDLHGDCLC